MVYINKPEFCIAKKSDGTEVYLGLRNDGTELAIKKVPRFNSSQVLNEEEILRLPELFDAPIARYNDYEEDEKFIYLALHLCEYTLEEYIKLKDGDQKKLAFQMLDGLKALHCQNPPILHGDLKPQNILIGGSFFGKSRRLPTGKTTVQTKEADIEMAGMLIYYIYTGGHQPFGDVPCDNIDVDDVLAKDLMEMMIDAEPQNRPKVEECLNHPLFWSTER
ncbi:putative serine/threonine-protein kinase irlA [Collichthys lucidus]|uniref:Putative serine/threonine-protein kinase irlA n=1 Tax=Collichthys lucidus TaxID=240159 RepID=A0A4U5TTY1_COLLU|nr:putative serine/threonine-protein kinase irlA [Collichthys lucidus]